MSLPEVFATAAGRSAGPAELVAIAAEAPVGPARRLLSAFPEEDAVLFEPPAGDAIVGLGAVRSIDVRGSGRFTALRAGAEDLFSRLAIVTAGGDAPPPRLMGGLAFESDERFEPPWAELGGGRFVLPRWTYVSGGARAWLIAVVPAGAEDVADRVRSEASRLLRALDAPEVRRAPASVIALGRSQPSEWACGVRAVRDAIATGRSKKVVLARRTRVEADRPFDADAVLASLGDEAPSSTLFAIRRGGSTFLGATPERLVRRRGPDVDTEALAGTAPRGDEGLLERAKDRAEHAHVVLDITERLTARCSELSAPHTPEIRDVGKIAHLCTPIRGQLAGPVHVLDLAADLHPTPATGGVPLGAALELIRLNERSQRGWYAGPIGWVDASGDGELWVALRSALLDGNKAYVYAGAGIVDGSDADAEYRETIMKERPVLAALGAW